MVPAVIHCRFNLLGYYADMRGQSNLRKSNGCKWKAG